MARLRFDFDGKKLNETEVLDLLSSSDASKREQAAKVFGKTLKDNIHLFSIITNTLSKDLQIENSLRGFKSCDSSRHLSNQVDPEDVDCLVKTVKKNYADLSHRYYKYKAKVFNVKRLNFWDRNAPYPKQKSQNISWKTAKEIVEKAYKDFDVKMRMKDEKPFITDEGNYIFDLKLNEIEDPRGLCGDLNIIPGVVENGLFIDVCSAVIVGHSDGTAEISWKKDIV